MTGYDVGYGTSSTTPSDIVSATSPKTISGLNPSTKYYFFVRGKNSVGNGAWSAAATVNTLAAARINVAGVWKTAIPYVNVGGVWKIARPWSNVAGVWKETT